MMKPPQLGDQELAVLRYVTDHAPITVREVAIRYGETHGLARTTILTMMERLRKKGFLTRRKAPGAFEYLPSVAKRELMQNLVQEFVENTLGGSLTPFVAYLSGKPNLTESEMRELKRLVAEMESGDSAAT